MKGEGQSGFNNIDRAIQLIDALTPIQNIIERIAEIKIRYQSMLFEPRLLFKYRKTWIAYLTAFRLYNSIKMGKILQPDSVGKDMNQIELYDRRLAKEVESILSLSDKSSDEIGHLSRYRKDVQSWSELDDTHLIDYFIRRVRLFLGGGVEDNVRFAGLYKDFRDAKLANRILTDNAVKNLLLYNQQVNYLKSLIDLCKKSEASGTWEGFFGKGGFWTEFKKKAQEFEKVYGNEYFAALLLSRQKQIGESPQAWGGVWEKKEVIDQRTGSREEKDVLTKDGELPRLLRQIEDYTYQKQRIIIPATLALQKILERREEELKAGVISEFLRLLRKKRKSLIKSLRVDIATFIENVEGTFSDYGEYLQKFDSVMSKTELWYIEQKTGKLVIAAQLYGRTIQQQLRRGHFLRDINEFMRTVAADEARAEARNRQWQYETFSHLTEEDFVNMQQLIQDAADTRKKLSTVWRYIALQLDENYILNIRSIERVDVGNIKNTYFKFSYVNRAVKRII